MEVCKHFFNENIIKIDNTNILNKNMLTLTNLYAVFRKWYKNKYIGKLPKIDVFNEMMSEEILLGAKINNKWIGFGIIKSEIN